MVRQNPADRASQYTDRDGAEGPAEGVYRHLGLLSGISLWVTSVGT